MVNIPFICNKIPAHADVYSWYNIPEFVFPITISLIDSFADNKEANEPGVPGDKVIILKALRSPS